MILRSREIGTGKNSGLCGMVDHQQAQAPVAIGGVGGSGTRLIASIVQKLGFYMGSDLNDSMDNLLFTLLFKRSELWPPENNQEELEYLTRLFTQYMHGQKYTKRDLHYLESLAAKERLQHTSNWLKERVEHFLAHSSEHNANTSWGWKEPNTHIFMPAISKLIPNLKYIHVMRHGLDMAYSSNQNQMNLWGKEVFGKNFNVSLGEPSFRYWAWAHRRVATFRKKLGNRFLILNFENFCSSPRDSINQIAKFLEVQVSNKEIEALANGIKAPETKGRYLRFLDFEPNNSDIKSLESLGYSFTK